MVKLNDQDIFYEYSDIKKIPALQGYYYKRGKGKTYKYRYLKNVSTFDIECTTWENEEFYDKPFSTMYIWQFCIDGICFYGRTWDEYLEFIHNIIDKYELNVTNRLVIFVHNLSYEWEFIKSFFHPIPDMCWINGKNVPVKIVTEEGIEFRCSYVLSNMSLRKFCENTENVIHGKLYGDLDYRLKRHSLTPLTIQEMSYCFNDVAGLYECVYQKLIEEKNGYFTLPITSTSYVRRDLREEIGQDRKYKEIVRNLKPDIELYDIMVKMFRGGNTHANRFRIGRNLENLGSMDLTSSYPFQMVYRKYPMKPFIKEKISLLKSKAYLQKCLQERACIIEVAFDDLDLKADVPIPYISSSRTNCYDADKEKSLFDNGRIVRNSHIEMYCTEIDLNIIFRQYNYSRYGIIRMWTAEKDYLPDHIVNNVLRYYEGKTKLKGVEYKEYEYGKSKNRLNGNFGMCCTNTVKDGWGVDLEGNYVSRKIEDREKALNDAYKEGFLAYQWGVWVAAYGRLQLQDGIDIVGMDCNYCDTDSVKYSNPEKYIDKFKEYNNNLIKKAKEKGRKISALNSKGEEIFMGTFDNDGTYKTFVTWGAKKYSYTSLIKGTKYYDVHITVSGASKRAGALAITKRLLKDRARKILSDKTIIIKKVNVKTCNLKYLYAITERETKYLNKYFRIGLVLNKNESGRTVAYRHGNLGKTILLDYQYNALEQEITSGIGIVETTYSLGISSQFEKFLSKIGVQIYD